MTVALVARVLDIIFWFWYVLLLARVVLSLLRLSPWHPVNRRIGPFVFAVTEPLLRPIRRALAGVQSNSPLDFSPLIAYLILQIVQAVIIRLLYAAA